MTQIEIKERIKKLLTDHNVLELGEILGMNQDDAQKIVHDLYVQNFGFNSPNDWTVEYCGEGQYALFADCGEWIDKNGDYLCFDTKQEALDYINKELA
jgi:hypothetical protein